MFLRMGTQWKIAGMGGYTGLDYTALETLMRLYSVDDPVAMFEGIQVMELEALLLLNDQQSNN